MSVGQATIIPSLAAYIKLPRINGDAECIAPITSSNSRSNARLSACAKHREANGRAFPQRELKIQNRERYYTPRLLSNISSKTISPSSRKISSFVRVGKSRIYKFDGSFRILPRDVFQRWKLEDFKIVSNVKWQQRSEVGKFPLWLQSLLGENCQ